MIDILSCIACFIIGVIIGFLAFCAVCVSEDDKDE